MMQQAGARKRDLRFRAARRHHADRHATDMERIETKAAQQRMADVAAAEGCRSFYALPNGEMPLPWGRTP